MLGRRTSLSTNENGFGTSRRRKLLNQTGDPPLLCSDNAVYDDGDLDAGAWSAGQAQGLIHDTPTVRELVERIISEAMHVISRLSALAS